MLRLGPDGRVTTSFALPRAVYGDAMPAHVRVGPDGRVYQLGSSPTTGATIRRHTLG